MTGTKQWTIYGLIDPRFPHAIRYVGITTDIQRRERQHRVKPSGPCAEHNSGLADWKMEVKAAGVELLAIPLETHGNLNSAQEAERHFIRDLRHQGTHDLLNIHIGGAWCLRTAESPEHRAKIGAALRGRHKPPPNAKQLLALARGWAINCVPGHIITPETRAKIAAARMGQKLSPEHVEKMRQASTGRIKSPEERAKLSAALRGRPKSPEARAKMAAAARGRVLSPAHRRHIAEAQLGRHPSAETRVRLSEAQRLRHQEHPFTAGTKAKISNALRRWWAVKRAQEAGD